uniref:WGS project CAEQ00000000 data, annotated contig 383 n=1 Tax=Trypanosoma congolense (strain IL3000) TaxID=1068625 RepID=F9WFG3_TRYCI|nr:unnamed protein product [Trypanosoma congolense IL3000]
MPSDVAELQHTDEEYVRQRLSLEFPSVDDEVLTEMAFLVGRRRHTMDEAVHMLHLVEKSRSGDAASAKGSDEAKVSDRHVSGPPVLVSPNLVPSSAKLRGAAAIDVLGDEMSEALRVRSTCRNGGAGAGASSAGAEQRLPVGVENPRTVKLFHTTMTGDRRIRAHCRQADTLLYLKRIRYEPVNVADSPLMQQRLRELYRTSTGRKTPPPLPALFVGSNYVGNYEEMQDMEDDGILMDTLKRLGYQHEATSNGVSQ